MADISGSHTLEIEAPIDRVFDIAADLDHAPEWQGAMKRVDVIERDSDGRATVVDAEIDSGVAKHRMRLRFDYDDAPGAMRWSRESGDLKSLEGSWTFEDLGGRTRATYALDIGLNRALSLVAKTIKGPAEQKVRELLAHRPVEGLKRRAEG